MVSSNCIGEHKLVSTVPGYAVVAFACQVYWLPDSLHGYVSSPFGGIKYITSTRGNPALECEAPRLGRKARPMQLNNEDLSHRLKRAWMRASHLITLENLFLEIEFP
jgi:hypothetical protein